MVSVMKDRIGSVLAWTGFFSLVFGVTPSIVLVAGYLLEERQVKPDLLQLSCHAIETELQQYQKDYGAALSPDFLETYDPEKCRIAGSGGATVWIRPGEPPTHGFIYARLSEEQTLKRLGYRSFFHQLSSDRYKLTLLAGAPWLPIVFLSYFFWGGARILPWRKA